LASAKRLDFVSDQAPMMLLLHQLGKTYHQPPSRWLGLGLQRKSSQTDEWSNTWVAELQFALDFDAACHSLGLDNERRVRESKQSPTVKVVTRRMGT
jgi:hypothetical protein